MNCKHFVDRGAKHMNRFWVLNGKKTKKYIMLAVAALFTAGIIFIEQNALSIFSPSSDTFVVQSDADRSSAIYSVETDERKLALTFDISWGQEKAGPILDVLEQKNVTEATFFLSSPWAEYHPDIVGRIQEMGFEIGSHGHKHQNYTNLKDEEIREQILKAHQILKSLTGETPDLIRLPNGDVDKRVLSIAEQLGYTVIAWDTDSKDWMNPGVNEIVHNVVSNAHPGDIILMHASDSSKQTHEALPQIIDQLRTEGYQFVTVSELITGHETDIREQD